MIILILVKTGYDSCRLAFTRYPNTKIRPYLGQALLVIKKRTPPESVILCYWADGYPIQTYCNRPTITDGLFESPEIVRRIIGISEIYYSYNKNELWDFCKEYGVTHILIPTNRKKAYAGYAGVDYDRYFRKNKVTPQGKFTTLYTLIFTPDKTDKFRPLYRNREFILYRVI